MVLTGLRVQWGHRIRSTKNSILNSTMVIKFVFQLSP